MIYRKKCGKLAHDIELGKLSDVKWKTGKEAK